MRPEVPQGQTNWHKTGELPDGTPIGQLGSLWYILDEKEIAVSEGYHEIRVTASGYEGKKGARVEKITLRNNEELY